MTEYSVAIRPFLDHKKATDAEDLSIRQDVVRIAGTAPVEDVERQVAERLKQALVNYRNIYQVLVAATSGNGECSPLTPLARE